MATRMFSRAMKRAIDVVGASLLLVLLTPVMVAVAVAVLVLDGRPIFFRQQRIGRDGRPFSMIKFRTMVPDAEDRLRDMRWRNERQGPLFKLTTDPRVTPIGRILRGTSLDELPQLVNVLSGSMSLVGPRPALPSEVAHFDRELRRRHAVRPGITGPWQVTASNMNSFEQYRALDLRYVDGWSVGGDLLLIVRTVSVVGRRGSAAITGAAGGARRRSTDPVPSLPDGMSAFEDRLVVVLREELAELLIEPLEASAESDDHVREPVVAA